MCNHIESNVEYKYLLWSICFYSVMSPYQNGRLQIYLSANNLLYIMQEKLNNSCKINLWFLLTLNQISILISFILYMTYKLF
jgi:hypothetical protein